jgi:catechol 2,3-dioxygenase-like lactoylglutathione lyase family enzyme
MIVGFNHTSFTVTDIQKSVKFWAKQLGFSVASVSPRQGKWQEDVTGVTNASLMVAHLYGHGQHIEFIQYLSGAVDGEAPTPALRCTAHVCLETNDIQKTWDELMRGGASAQGKIASVTTGAVSGSKAVYIRDPNGILIELVQLPANQPEKAEEGL